MIIKSNFKNILKKYEKSNGKISLRQFSRLSGLSLSSTQRLFHNQIKGFKFDTMEKLVKFFQVPPSKLIKYSTKKMIFSLNNFSKTTDELIHYTDGHGVSSYGKYIRGIFLSWVNHSKSIDILLIPYEPTYTNDTPNTSTVTAGKIYQPNFFDFYYQAIAHGQPFAIGLLTHKSQNKYLKYVLNHLSSRIQNYIYSRMILHSGLVNRSSNIDLFHINGSTVNTALPTRQDGYNLKFRDKTFKMNVAGLLHIWKRQPVEYDKHGNKYRLISSNQGQPISIHDYTTNNFKD